MAVRNESVRLSLEDDFSSGMARAAAATALLNRELNNLSGQSVTTARVSKNINRDTDALARSAQKADTSINQLTGRLRLFADLAAILGPSLIPIGAVGIPAIAGLANQLGAAALAGGTAIIAFQGVGDALKAVNEASISPTAKNLEEARVAMESLSPAARDVVTRLQELRPVMTALRDTAAAGLFPGLIEAFDNLERRLPEVDRILLNVSETLGEVINAGAEGLASSRWDDFFNFLATDVPDTLVSLGHTVGDLTHGMAELWMAFDPLNDDFNNWLRDVASGFDEWASGLSETQGFREFIDYVRTTGPQVAETFRALGDAIVQIVQAASPLGGPVLAGLEAVAKAISAIADSDLGTPIMTAVASLALLSRATATYGALAKTTWGTSIAGAVTGYAASLIEVESAQKRAQTSAASLDTATKSLSSSLIAAGAAAAGVAIVGGALDSWDDAALSANQMELALRQLADGNISEELNNLSWGAKNFGEALTEAAWADIDFGTATDEIEQLDAALAGMDPATAKAAFATITEEGQKAGLSLKEITDLFPEYHAAVQLASGVMTGAGRGIAGFGEAVEGIAGSFREATGAVDGFSASMDRLNAFFDKRAAIRSYEAALDDFRKGLKETGTSFDIATEKGRANQENLDAIGTSALKVAEQLTGIRRVKFVEGVVAQLREMASNLRGPARAAVQDVIGELQTLAKQKPKPKIDVETRAALAGISNVDRELTDVDRRRAKPVVDAVTEAAMAALRGVQGMLGSIDGRVATSRIYVDTIHRVYRQPGGGRIPLADGGYVRGPGGPRDDLVPANLSNGEYVIQAAAVAKYGKQTFDRLNAMNFANGGYVSPVPVRHSTTSSVVTNHGPRLETNVQAIYAVNPNEAVRVIETRQRDALALSRLA